MVRQLFLDCIAAGRELNTDEDLRRRMEKVLPKIAPTVVDPGTGELQEYLDSDHRIANRGVAELLSHWGLIWADQMSPRRTPELAAAMRKAYEAPDRRPWITGEVGSWQGAFPANTFARLHDGDRVEEILATHFRRVVQPNFTAGFSQSEWEIDGNLGMMAAIGELFLQSHDGEIELLPALPKSCATQGSFKGLCARGGYSVDCAWKDGKVVSFSIRRRSPDAASRAKVRVNGEVKEVAAE
jgi:alpha-L-fucosidase 2